MLLKTCLYNAPISGGVGPRLGPRILAGFGNQCLATSARNKLRRGTIIREPVVARNLFPFIVALDSRFPRPFRAAPTTSAAGPNRRDQFVGLRLAPHDVGVRLPLLVRQPQPRDVRHLRSIPFHGRRVRPPRGQGLGRRALLPELLQARHRAAPDVRQGVGRVAAHGAEPGIHQGVPGIAGGHEAGTLLRRGTVFRRDRGKRHVFRRDRGKRHVFFVVREAASLPTHDAAGTVTVAGTLGATLWSASGAAIAWAAIAWAARSRIGRTARSLAVVSGAAVSATLRVVVEHIPIKGRLPRRAHRVHGVHGRCRSRDWRRGRNIEVRLGKRRAPHLPRQIVVDAAVAAEPRHCLLQHGKFARG